MGEKLDRSGPMSNFVNLATSRRWVVWPQDIAYMHEFSFGPPWLAESFWVFILVAESASMEICPERLFCYFRNCRFAISEFLMLFPLGKSTWRSYHPRYRR
jgi:hypothetical protein